MVPENIHIRVKKGLCQHASGVFIFASTCSDQVCLASSKHLGKCRWRAASTILSKRFLPSYLADTSKTVQKLLEVQPIQSSWQPIMPSLMPHYVLLLHASVSRCTRWTLKEIQSFLTNVVNKIFVNNLAFTLTSISSSGDL